MKLTSVLLFSSIALAQTVAIAQTAAPAKPHVAAKPVTAATPGCVKMSPLSPKIPALAASAPCAKAIYTLTTVPQVKTSDAPPAVAASVREYLGIDSVTFSLAYIDTKIGTGVPAEPHKWYSVLYTGYLQDGTVFDSSAKHPEMGPFVLQQGAHKVIPGWDTGFYGMRVGGKRRLFIPHQLAYGPRGNGAVPPNADLIFDIELVSQSDKEPPPPTPPAAAPKPPTPATPSAPATATPPSAAPAPAAQPSSAPASPATAPTATSAPSATPPAATPPKPQ
jgi:peptidylprolyl isomerase